MVPNEIYMQIANAEHICNGATAFHGDVEYWITNKENSRGFMKVQAFKDSGKGLVDCHFSEIPDIPEDQWHVVDEY